MPSTAVPPVPEIFAEILDGAIREILHNEDPDRLFDWFRQQLSRGEARRAFVLREDGDVNALAQAFGRALWNATPLPGNDFRPKPLPSPGRNDVCPCGSGRKFKRCCGNAPPLPPFDSQSLWPLVLNRMPAKMRRQAIAAGKAPIVALIGVANEHLDEGKPGKARDTLEPVFAGKIHGDGEDHDYALTLLCNVYDDLGHTSKKKALLARIVSETRRSPLRSGALQRLATIKMDAGNSAGAWADFHAAQRNDPKSPSVGLLEVQLLLAEGRRDVARERAGFWAKRLLNLGFPDEEGGPVAFMKAIARDPEQTMADVGLGMAGGAGRGLIEWLQRVGGRPLPEYRLADELPAFPLDDEGQDAGNAARLAERLRNLGVPEAEVRSEIERLRSQIAELVADAEETDEFGEMDELDERNEFSEIEELDAAEEFDPDYGALDSLFLIAPPSVAAVEAEWHAVFLHPKPFSVQRTTSGDDGVWDTEEEENWMAFLEACPAAFDSLDVLDDLAAAVENHPRREATGIGEKLLRPLLERARAIIESALSEAGEPQLHWGWSENRPALRSLVRLAYVELEQGNERAAAALARAVVSLNPNDNHGLRTLVINGFLREGDDEHAVELARRYPDDLHPDIAYGEALALFRLERREEAREALDRAVERLPKVPRFLIAERVRKPKLDPMGIRIGGDDQAWIYRGDMRDAWSATPGALEWLRAASKRRK